MECSSIFRVPTTVLNRHHKPGMVHKGEEIRKSKLKYVLAAVGVIALLVLGFYSYVALKPPPVVADPFENRHDLDSELTALGVLQRFLESWKLGDMRQMMKYARACDRPKDGDKEFEEKLQTRYGNVRLQKYQVAKFRPTSESLYEFRVNLEGEDVRTKGSLKGGVDARVLLDAVNPAQGKMAVWGVSIRSDSDAPVWE
jgi:hypothetical protein